MKRLHAVVAAIVALFVSRLAVTLLAFGVLALGVSTTTFAADVHQITVRVEPKQEVTAIVVRAGEATQSVSVRNGAIGVPKELPFPLQLGMTRFEAAPYTRDDFEQKRPWVIRELGAIAGRVQRPSPKPGERFVWLLQPSGSDRVVER
jgi:hypothetical protein